MDAIPTTNGPSKRSAKQAAKEFQQKLDHRAFKAASNGEQALLRELLRAGARVDLIDEFTGNLATVEAAQMNHLGCLQAMVDSGANMSKRNHSKLTPLIAAVEEGSDACVAYLATAPGIDLEVGDGLNMSALFRACMVPGHHGRSLAKMLIDAGADLEARADGRHTPLMWAAHCGNLGVLDLLLESGADFTKINSKREDALAMAHHSALVNLSERSKQSAKLCEQALISWRQKAELAQSTQPAFAPQRPNSI